MRTAGNKTELPKPVVDAIMQRNSLDAISMLSKSENIDFREAKRRVDAYIDAHPEIYRELEIMRDRAAENVMRFGVVAVIVVVMLMVWLMFL